MTRSAIRKREERRRRRILHVRKKVVGTPERPRLAVFRSHKHFSAQVIDDMHGVTLAAASTLEKEVRGDLPHGGNIAAAERVGAAIAQRARAGGITKVVLDRRFYRYHGRVKAFAEAARKAGLEF